MKNTKVIATMLLIIVGLFLIIDVVAIILVEVSSSSLYGTVSSYFKRGLLLFMVSQTLFNLFIEFVAYRLLILVGDAKSFIHGHINWHKEMDKREGIERRPLQ